MSLTSGNINIYTSHPRLLLNVFKLISNVLRCARVEETSIKKFIKSLLEISLWIVLKLRMTHDTY